MLSNVNWRRSRDFKKATEYNMSHFKRGYEVMKMGFWGYSFDGHPIRIIEPTNFDPKMIQENFSVEMRYNYALQHQERNLNILLPTASLRSNKFISGFITIINLRDLNIYKFITNYELLKDYIKYAKEFQDNYPEMCHKTLLINSGAFISWIWPFAKLVLSHDTVQKF